MSLRERCRYAAKSIHLLLGVLVAAIGVATIVGSGGGSNATDAEGNPIAGAPTWFKSFGGGETDIAYAATATSDGGYAFTGMFDYDHSSSDLWLTKLDAAGDVVWQRAYGRRALLSNGLWSLVNTDRRPAQGPDGSIWFLGAGRLDDTVGGRSGLVVAKLDADGAPAWAKSFDSGAYPNYDFYFPDDEVTEDPAFVTPTADGGALVAAWNYARVDFPTTGGSTLREARHLWLLKLSSTGNLQWTRRVTDDQFRYANTQYAEVSPNDPETVVMRELENGTFLVNIVTTFADANCGACQVPHFVATRFVHLRSGGEVIVNALVPYERVRGGLAMNQITDRSLPGAVVIDDDQDGQADRYLLVGTGEDVPIGLVNDSAEQWAMAVELNANGILSQERFFTEWPENSTELTAAALSCTSGAPCRVIAAGEGPTATCDRATFLAEINADDLVDTHRFALEQTNDTSCVALRPTRFDIRPAAQAPDVNLFTLSGIVFDEPYNPSTTVLRKFSSAIPAAGDSTVLGTLDTISAQANPQTATMTPDGQLLGISQTDDAGDAFALIRVDGNGETTLSKLLEVPMSDPALFEGGLALSESPDQGFIVVGQSTSFGPDTAPHAWVLKTDRDGRIVWQRHIPGLKTRGFGTPNVLVDADGALFGASWRDEAPVLVKLDTRGDLAWLLPLPLDCFGCSIRLAALPNGDVIAVSNAMEAPWMARVTPAGSLVWLHKYPFAAPHFEDVDILADGNVLVTGNNAAWSFTPDGQPLWSRAYDIGRLGLERAAYAMDGSGALDGGGFLMAFSVESNSTPDDSYQDVLLIRADANGDAQWERLLGARYREDLFDLQVLADGGALLAGTSLSLGDNREAWVARLGADGRVAAGCNASLGEYSSRLSTALSTAGLAEQTRTIATDSLPTAQVTPLLSDGAEFPLSSNDVVVARQCSGTAALEDPGPAPAHFTLTVTSDDPLPGAITSAPTGISCGTALDACAADFEASTFVVLQPDTAVIDRLVRWNGCDRTEGGFCIVQMRSARTVTAVFRTGPPPPQLTIASITGDGRVGDGAGLDCRSDALGLQGVCTASYPSGNTITLIATPGGGQSLLAWGGDCVVDAANPNHATVLMDQARSCSIAFTGVPLGSPVLEVVPEALDNGNPVDPSPIGLIQSDVAGIDCGTDCSEAIAAGSFVTLTASVTPTASAAGWEFERFVCPGIPADQINARVVTLQVDVDVSCTARFRNTIKRLYVDISNGIGTVPLGRVVSEPASLDCMADCDVPFPNGQFVILRARPKAGAALEGWQGCDSNGPDPDPSVVPSEPGQIIPEVCYVTTSQTRTVAAFFDLLSIGNDPDHTLTVTFSGSGSPPPGGFVNSTPPGISCATDGGTCAYPFPPGTVVRLEAGAYPGSILTQFSGCSRLNPDGNPATFDCEVDMTTDRLVQIGLARP
jgi:Divergent InlB B-repeat domain